MRFIIKAETTELKQIVHEFVTCCPYGQDACNIVDQTLGKTYDDGYKAIHVYVRPNNYVSLLKFNLDKNTCIIE
ncbi:hypothetical protein JS44_09500 [Anoxybacillus flavithermus]|uniref:Uncharacterized protein n=1 Tax=Anoxybacillus flavithermus TaxID=33934 RepID=A0A094LBY8_9BACL|nr:hypothetical protein JS44_09500 [Anoxybacillus flavithermus]